MSDPLRQASTRATPQGQRVPGRNDQVINDAEGYVFQTDPWHQLDRFLILGTWGNTLYVEERKLTTDNVSHLIDLISEDSKRVTDRAVEISQSGRAPRNNPAIFAIAAVAGLAKTPTERAYALNEMPKVARTSTHLFTFVNYVQQFRGWGRSLRRGVASWYTSRTPESVAYQMVKYRQREGWTHRDVLLKAHVKPVDESMAKSFDFAAGRVNELTGDEKLAVIDAFLQAQNLGDNDVDQAVTLIQEGGLPWETLPDGLLDKPAVWEALLPKMGQTALLRQLPRLTRIGLLKPLSEHGKNIAEMLTDKERLIRGRIHPIGILNALATYRSGHSLRGNTTWEPNEQIVNALDEAFYLSFDVITPAGVRTLNALDVSSSMDAYRVAGSPALTARDASVAMSMVTLATEPLTHTVAFTGNGWGRSEITTFSISARERIDDAVANARKLRFGRTDCALPMLWALENKVEVDAFHIYTDNETWAGVIHPFQAVRQYREKMGIDAKVIVYGMEGRPFTIADPRDPGMMDVAGLDSSAPQLAADFAGGRL